MEPTRQPRILLILSEDQLHSYDGVLRKFPYPLTNVFEEWDTNLELQRDPRVQRHCGPLCSGFIETLTEKDPEKYDLVLVDLLSEDLISPLRESGYQGPIVVIGNPQRKNYPVPFVKFGEDFDERLRKTLEKCLAQTT